MAEKQEKSPLNVWLEEDIPLKQLPEIKKSLPALRRQNSLLAEAYARYGLLPWKRQPEGFEGHANIILAQHISTALATPLARCLSRRHGEVFAS
ncbi:MAG: hypothetical protein Q8K65_01460 [Alphaproteobacteria bacterium]|nr:hypothetical protein [Alphaproteobacteria bacterium]